VPPAALEPPPPSSTLLTPIRTLSSFPGILHPQKVRRTSRSHRRGSCSAVEMCGRHVAVVVKEG